MVDGNSVRDGQFGDPAKQSNNEQASQRLLFDAQSDRKGVLPDTSMKEIVDEIARQQGFKGALKSEPEAEISWNQAFPGGEKSVSADKLKQRLQDPKLDGRSKGFIQFLDENFDKLAGISGKGDKQLCVTDVMAAAAMNQVDPVRMDGAVDFLKKNYFQVSGMDDKVNKERLDRILFDHSFSLFPKETQERLMDLSNVLKSADQRPSNFDQTGKRTKSGLVPEDADKLSGQELSDNLRVQSLQKYLFGAKTQKFDGKQLGAEAKSQFDTAQKRFKELQAKGLDKFLASLEKSL